MTERDVSDATAVPILPICDEDALPFYEGTRQGELRVQRCPDSGRLLFPPRPTSPYGSHRAPDWVAVAGRGTLWSFVIPHPPLLPAFARLAPYNVIVVALEEDPSLRMVGNLVAREGGGIDEIDPATIAIGAPVRVVFETVASAGESFVLPRWILA